MTYVIIFLLIIGLFALKALLSNRDLEATEVGLKYKYSYQSKQWFMSKNEHDAFCALMQAVGDEYFIFPQVKLDKILDWKGNGKNAMYAMRHINQKSVDYLLCDKKYLNPRLAIELDDSTHTRPDRIERDHEVERILKDANFPLLRLIHSDTSSVESLRQNVLRSLRV